MDELKEGDIVEVQKGCELRMVLPYHFVYANREGVFDELAATTVIAGETHNGLSTNFLLSEFVVLSASHMSEDCSAHNDRWTEHWYEVVLEKLQDNETNSRVRVKLHQKEDSAIVKKGRAKAKWSRVEQ